MKKYLKNHLYVIPECLNRGSIFYFKICIVIFIIFFHSQAFASVSSQTLLRGQSTNIELKFEIGDIAVTDPKVCDYLVGQDRKSLYLNARVGGETTITIWDASGKQREEFIVRVVTNTLKELLDKAKSEYGDLSGVRVDVQNGHVEITGEVAEPDDFRRIENASRADPRLKSRIRLSQGTIELQAEAIRDAINVPGIEVRAIRDRIVLEGVAYSQADAKRAVEIAKLYAPEVIDLIDVRESGRQVGRSKMIELTFHMMEVKKSALRELGVNWAPGAFPAGDSGNASAGAGLLASVGQFGKEILGFVLQFVPKLKVMRESGNGRVLENPSIIVKSGEQAKIFSGTEVPYYKGSDVQFKKVGIEIEAMPVEVKGGIDIKLSASISSPTSDLRGAIDTHTISTAAICPLNTSLVLANVIGNSDVKMKNRVPRDLDTSSALFTLFLSKDFQSNRSEFVIFVTPRIISVPSSADAELGEFLSMEESMIRDRSKKEFAIYSSSKTGAMPLEDNPPDKKSNKRRWR